MTLVPSAKIERSAHVSNDGRYRYALWRRWGLGPYALFILLNPSTADAEKEDPTSRRCINFAASWGYNAMCIVNLFAYRSTDPAGLLRADDPVGHYNNETIRMLSVAAAIRVAAWGNHGSFLGRGTAVRSMVRGLQILKMTKLGHPSHPLYLPASLKPQPWKD